MLAIRLQRIGRSGYPVYRVAVQESQRHPSSGRVVAYVGSYNPHTKQVTIQKDDVQKYLDNGAQPTPRVVKLLKDAGIALPSWVKQYDATKQKQTKHVGKLRSNTPAEEAPEEPAVEEVAEATEEAATEEQASEETVADEPAAEKAE